MNTIRFQSREAFIDALEQRRPFWHEFDQRREREHKAAEKQWLADARTKMREALKMDYGALKERIGWNGSLSLGKVPECPVLMEPKIENVLASLRLTQSKSFTVDSQGVWAEAHRLLTWDPDARTKVC